VSYVVDAEVAVRKLVAVENTVVVLIDDCVLNTVKVC